MPRKGRGGSRQGTPGTAYTNRTDLAENRQPVRVPTGQPYGEAGRQEQAQQAMPLPDLSAMLSSLPGLTDESRRPDEPITAGLPTGPGPGPEALAAPPPDRSGVGLIKRMLRENPDPELFALLAEAERSQGGYLPGMR